jgi:hypothetical protein
VTEKNAQQRTNFEIGLDYLRPAIDRAPYAFWRKGMDKVPSGSPAYAVNHPVPPIQQIIDEGLYCQAVVNLILRRNHMRVPTFGNPEYDGGTRANQIYFAKYDEPFDRWANYPRGTLIGRYFSWKRLQQGDQGHVAVILTDKVDNPYILQSYPPAGLTNNVQLGTSHAGWYYEYAVRPHNWINYSDPADEF